MGSEQPLGWDGLSQENRALAGIIIRHCLMTNSTPDVRGDTGPGMSLKFRVSVTFSGDQHIGSFRGWRHYVQTLLSLHRLLNPSRDYKILGIYNIPMGLHQCSV